MGWEVLYREMEQSSIKGKGNKIEIARLCLFGHLYPSKSILSQTTINRFLWIKNGTIVFLINTNNFISVVFHHLIQITSKVCIYMEKLYQRIFLKEIQITQKDKTSIISNL